MGFQSISHMLSGASATSAAVSGASVGAASGSGAQAATNVPVAAMAAAFRKLRLVSLASADDMVLPSFGIGNGHLLTAAHFSNPNSESIQSGNESRNLVAEMEKRLGWLQGAGNRVSNEIDEEAGYAAVTSMHNLGTFWNWSLIFTMI